MQQSVIDMIDAAQSCYEQQELFLIVEDEPFGACSMCEDRVTFNANGVCTECMDIQGERCRLGVNHLSPAHREEYGEHEPPGHRGRILLYAVRAELKQPLFNGPRRREAVKCK